MRKSKMTIKQLQKICYKIAVEKGFWDNNETLEKFYIGQSFDTRNNAEMIALMHSELSEALEATRKKGNPQSKKIPKFKLVEEELADCIIRILDMAEGRKYNIEGALNAKIKYNKKRRYKHGKKF